MKLKIDYNELLDEWVNKSVVRKDGFMAMSHFLLLLELQW